jgi:hypothetical protein
LNLLHTNYLKFIGVAALLSLALNLSAQTGNNGDTLQKHKPINQVDENGRRTGLWLISHQERMGEDAYFEFGDYDIGRKTGPWYKIDKEESLLAIENYRNDVLHGEVKYFDHGILLCIGHYRGLNTANLFDTIYVRDPETDTMVQRIISSDHGSLKHGVWKYYDEETGKLVKEEEYQVDDLIYRKEYSPRKDNKASAQNEKGPNHRKRQKYRPPAGKEFSYLIK